MECAMFHTSHLPTKPVTTYGPLLTQSPTNFCLDSHQSHHISSAMTILVETLQEILETHIRWPRRQSEFQANSDLIVAQHPHLNGAFAGIDGLNLPVQTSDDVDIRNATYNDWKSDIKDHIQALLNTGQQICGTPHQRLEHRLKKRCCIIKNFCHRWRGRNTEILK